VPVPSVAARQGTSPGGQMPNGQRHGPTSGVPAGVPAGNPSTLWPGQL
jgi:hypothetical protein